MSVSTGAPRVSVFMASYNGEAYVADAVRAVLSQTFRDLELIIVDDGSRAPTLEILRGLAATDVRMRLIEGRHRGQIGTLNHALEHCRADLVARIDHDDNMVPERIARQVAYMDANPDVVAIGSATVMIDEQGRNRGTARTEVNRHGHRPDRLPPEIVFLMGPTLMARRAAIAHIGGYRPQFRAAEDRDISWRLAGIGKTAHVPEPLTEHRDHAQSLGLSERRTQAFGHLVCDLSAIAAHSGRDDSAILLALEPGGDYPSAIAGYKALLSDLYPVETLILLFYAKPRFQGLDGVPPPRELRRMIVGHVAEQPMDVSRWRLLPRLVRLALGQTSR